MTNRILTKGFWNEQKIVLKGFGRGLRGGGFGTLKELPKIEIPAHTELNFEVKAPVETDIQTNFEIINDLEINKTVGFPMNSPLLRVNNFFFDIDLAIAMNKQLNLPLSQGVLRDNKRLIKLLKAI